MVMLEGCNRSSDCACSSGTDTDANLLISMLLDDGDGILFDG